MTVDQRMDNPTAEGMGNMWGIEKWAQRDLNAFNFYLIAPGGFRLVSERLLISSNN